MVEKLNCEELSSELKHHEELFTGTSLEMGKIQWYFLKADTEWDNKYQTEKKHKPAFDRDVYTDPIHWWVFKKETDIRELLNRIEGTLKTVQTLKEDSFILKGKYFESYYELIKKIKDFTISHEIEINNLYEYVVWLHEKDVFAPIILFNYRIWGTTRLAEKRVKITSNINESIKECTELAFGLRNHNERTLLAICNEIAFDIWESRDFPDEFEISVPVPAQNVIIQTSHKILDEFSSFFEFIRQSLRNIILEIEKYDESAELLYSESFWVKFIRKSMGIGRIESQLWDFKETFDMWETTNKDKEEANKKFCRQIAAYANTTGGVLFVGITDTDPRKIKGIEGLENKLKSAKSVIKKYIDYNRDFTHFQQILMRTDDDAEKSCLYIAISQTQDAIGVKESERNFSYPIREQTGLGYSNYPKIRDSKESIYKDNYLFISNLHKLLEDN